MSDPRPTAREHFHGLLKLGGFTHFGFTCPNWCDNATAAIAARDAASDAREDLLREALATVSRWRPQFQGAPHIARCECGVCLLKQIAHDALAAIPPRSDR